MADKPKGGGKDKKPEAGPALGPLGDKNIFEFLLFAGIAVIILTAIVSNFFGFVQSILLRINIDTEAFAEKMRFISVYAKFFSFFLGIYLIYLAYIFTQRVNTVKAKLNATFSPPPAKPLVGGHVKVEESKVVKMWKRVEGHIASDNPNDWKVAIIEADTILDEMVERMSYKGITLGERMKNIEKSDFNTLDDAWEAHKVRNAIAHDASFVLTEREARRVIELYRNVFKEFSFLD
jgi:hypothetical protein